MEQMHLTMLSIHLLPLRKTSQLLFEPVESSITAQGMKTMPVPTHWRVLMPH